MKVIAFSGSPETGKSPLIKEVMKDLLEQGVTVVAPKSVESVVYERNGVKDMDHYISQIREEEQILVEQIKGCDADIVLVNKTYVDSILHGVAHLMNGSISQTPSYSTLDIQYDLVIYLYEPLKGNKRREMKSMDQVLLDESVRVGNVVKGHRMEQFENINDYKEIFETILGVL